MSALRIVFFGTPEIAVPTLENLIAGPHEVVGVVSQPDRQRGRGRKESPSPVSAVALRQGLPLLRPEKVGDAETIKKLRSFSADLGIVVAFGQFLPKKVREMPRCGYLINAHASLLPSYRGASPIAQAILDGETETGVSVMRVEKEMDAGPVGLVMRTAIEERENTEELTHRLGALAGLAIELATNLIASDEIKWTEQDESRATLAPKLEKADALLDLREGADALARRVHALSPKPGGTLTLVSDLEEEFGSVEVKISRAATTSFESVGPVVGEAGSSGVRPQVGSIECRAGDSPLRIATGEGWLLPLVMQRAGGKALPTADFLRGFELPDDVRCALPEDAPKTRSRATS